MQDNQDAKWMREALKLARKAERQKDVPVGAVMVHQKDDRLISKGYNTKESKQNPLGHAEIMAIEKAAKKLGQWRLSDLTLYVTLEPCLMCSGALWQARIGRIVFGTLDPKGHALRFLCETHTHLVLNEGLSGVYLEDESLRWECSQLIKTFFQKKRQPYL